MSLSGQQRLPFNPQTLPPSLQVLLQKQQERAGLQALREASAGLVERAEKLAEQSNVMADGGEGWLSFTWTAETELIGKQRWEQSCGIGPMYSRF